MANLVLNHIQVLNNERHILDIANQNIQCHSITGVIGANGSGKTTLLKVIAGLIQDPQFNLSIPYDDVVMVLHQTPMIKMSVYHHLQLLKDVYPDLKNDQINQVIEEYHLHHLRDQPATKLSAGEKQRLALARAHLMGAKLWLLDEPTASLDPSSTQLIESKIVELTKQGIHFIVASHDLAQVKRLCDQVVYMDQGKIQEHRPTNLFFQNPQTLLAQEFIKFHL